MTKAIARKGNFFVYIVRCTHGTLYTGYTNDLDKRFKMHNSGKGAKYLRGKGPVRLVWSKEYRYYKNAIKAENRIKRMTKKQKEQLVGP
ncbi:MAG: GIY-YIG nuclease family protein [Candidatus Omnitrophica bacterium]|nr:GIY-YIG nuclease family protein [Candidatus Omnitrophota bacterium]